MEKITMEKSNTDELSVAEDKAEPAKKPQDQAEKQLHDFLNNQDHDEGGESGESGEAS